MANYVTPDLSTLNLAGSPSIARNDVNAIPIVSPTSVGRQEAPRMGSTQSGLNALTGGALGGLLGMIIDRNKAAASGYTPTPNISPILNTGTKTPGTQTQPKPGTPTGSGGTGSGPYVPPGGYPNPGTPTVGTPEGNPIGGGNTGSTGGLAFPALFTQEQITAATGETNGQPNYVIAGVDPNTGVVIAQPNLNIGPNFSGNTSTAGTSGIGVNANPNAPQTEPTGGGYTAPTGLGGMTGNTQSITSGYGTDASGNIYQYNPDGSTTLVYTALGNGMYIYDGPSTNSIPSGSILDSTGTQVFPNYGSYFDTTVPVDTTGGFDTTPTVDVTAPADNTYYTPIDTTGSMFGSGTSTDTSVYTPIDTSGGMFSSFFKDGGLATPLFKEGGQVKHFASGGINLLGSTVTDPLLMDTTNLLGVPTDTTPVGIDLTAAPTGAGIDLSTVDTSALVDPAASIGPIAYNTAGTGFIDQVAANAPGAILNAVSNNSSGSTSSPGGLLNNITSLLSNSGVQGTLIGALLGQLLSSSSTGSVNQGVDMSHMGSIPGRTTTFGMGPANFVNYNQYGVPTSATNAYDPLYNNLGVSSQNASPLATMMSAPDHTLLTPAVTTPGILPITSQQWSTAANSALNPPHFSQSPLGLGALGMGQPVSTQSNANTLGKTINPPGLNPALPSTGYVPGVTTPTSPSTYTYGNPVDPKNVLNPTNTTPSTGGLRTTIPPITQPPITPPVTPPVTTPPTKKGQHHKTGGLSIPEQTMPNLVEGRHDYRQGAAVNGEGDGQSDDIPAMLADGEYVIDAETVAQLGNGSNKAGAKVLDGFRQNIRAHKRNTPLNKIPPKSKSPLAYLKGIK
jgi:hypothetical protein